MEVGILVDPAAALGWEVDVLTMKHFYKDFVTRLPQLGASKEFLPFTSGPSLSWQHCLKQAVSIEYETEF